MMVVDCACGDEVPFVAEEGTTAPMRETCSGCGQTYELNIKKLSPKVKNL